MPKHAQKMPQSMYKNPQGSKHRFLAIFGDFSTFMTQFWSFSGQIAFWGGCKKGKKCPKMPKLPKNRRKSHPNCPENPPKWAKTPTGHVRKKWFFTFSWHFAKNNLSRKLSEMPRNAQKCPENDQKMTKNDQKWPKVPKSAQKCPKACTKTLRDQNIDFWRCLAIFRPSWPSFGHFRVRSRFEGGAEWAKNGQKCQKCQKTAGNHTQIPGKPTKMGQNPHRSR